MARRSTASGGYAAVAAAWAGRNWRRKINVGRKRGPSSLQITKEMLVGTQDERESKKISRKFISISKLNPTHRLTCVQKLFSLWMKGTCIALQLCITIQISIRPSRRKNAIASVYFNLENISISNFRIDDLCQNILLTDQSVPRVKGNMPRMQFISTISEVVL